ncbi:acetamidase/formamidase family protein [candidate division KSB1 bacterium]
MNRAIYMRLALLLNAVLLCNVFNFQSFCCELPKEAGKTHYFEPTHYYSTFSFAHPPVLRIKPGDRIVTKTIDANGFDYTNTLLSDGGNPQTGPFYVEGAESGDVLIVRLEKIKPNRGTALSVKTLAPYVVDPDFLRIKALRERGIQETWQVDTIQSIARTTSDGIQPSYIEVPLQPMLGCVGVAPQRKEAVHTSSPGNFGGNMDYPGIREGVTLMLPVYEPGALLFVGDGHGRQGHGEILGNALEVSMNVEFSVDLIKNKKIGWPRLENDEYIMVIGSARPLLQALQHATTEMLHWMMNDYGFDERGASLLMGHAIEYDIANVVDPHFTVVAKIKKVFLRSGR